MATSRSELAIVLKNHPAVVTDSQYRAISRSLASLNLAGLRHQSVAMQIALLNETFTQVLMTETIFESRLRDLAADELTREEYARFDHEFDQLHALHRAAQQQALTTQYHHLLGTLGDGKSSFFDDVEEGANAVLHFFFGRRK